MDRELSNHPRRDTAGDDESLIEDEQRKVVGEKIVEAEVKGSSAVQSRMETTLFLAKFWGAIMIIMPLAMLVRPQHAKGALEGIRNEAVMLIFGMIALVLGLVTVLMHNVWSGGIELAVTIIGWLALIKGVTYMIFPGMIRSMVGIFENKSTRSFLLVIALIVGLWLCYSAFTG